MSAAKHTPGPWTMQEREHSFRVVDHRALEFDNSRLCDVLYWSGSTRGPDQEESRANARLIAAAPDLLEALKVGYTETMDYIQRNHLSGSENNQWLVLARAAIAKATGEQQ